PAAGVLDPRRDAVRQGRSADRSVARPPRWFRLRSHPAGQRRRPLTPPWPPPARRPWITPPDPAAAGPARPAEMRPAGHRIRADPAVVHRRPGQRHMTHVDRAARRYGQPHTTTAQVELELHDRREDDRVSEVEAYAGAVRLDLQAPRHGPPALAAQRRT